MLPKRFRLNAGEVQEVLSKGRPLRVGPYAGKFLSGRSPLGVAVIVSKKVAPKATKRNNMRRQAYRALEKETLPKEGSLAIFLRA